MVMGIYLRPFNKVLGSTTNLFWWYKPFICGGLYLGPFYKALSSTTNLLWQYKFFICGGLCPIYFFGELGFSGFISVL
jgi:hypothetical protein